MINNTSDILLVEDSEDDYLFVKRAFNKANLKNPLTRVADGKEAMDYLLAQGDYTDRKDLPLPGLILLDLNLPKMKGDEVLVLIRKNEKLSKLPVIMLTTSADQVDVNKCYELGANSYVTKPVNFQGLIDALNKIHGFWFEIALCPKD